MKAPDGTLPFDVSTLHILRLAEPNLPEAAAVIRQSFATVVQEYGLNRQEWPTHPGFMNTDAIPYQTHQAKASRDTPYVRAH